MSGGHGHEAPGGHDDHGHAPKASSGGGSGGGNEIAGAAKEFSGMIGSILKIFG